MSHLALGHLAVLKQPYCFNDFEVLFQEYLTGIKLTVKERLAKTEFPENKTPQAELAFLICFSTTVILTAAKNRQQISVIFFFCHSYTLLRTQRLKGKQCRSK